MQRVDLSTYIPDFAIEIGGAVRSEIRNSTTSISINEKVGGDPAQFTLVLADEFNVASQSFVWLEKFLSQDSPLFSDEEKITIYLGYSGKLKKMITANLKSLSTSGFSSDITRLTLTGYDASHKFLTDQSSGSTSNNNKKGIIIEKNDTYSSIAEKLADTAGLEKEVDPTTRYRPITIKKSVTYVEFLKDAAKRVGYDFFITNNTLFFINPRKERKIPKRKGKNDNDSNNSKQSQLILKWHANLQEFAPTINMSNLIPEVEVRGNLPNSRKLVVKKASVGDEEVVENPHQQEGNTATGSQLAHRLKHEKLEITDRNFYTEEEATDIAKAELNIVGDKLVTASGSMIGYPDLTPGQYIRIEGVGKQLSGKYYVTDVTHTIDANGYSTKFNVSRNNIVMG
jgi:phage protein D